MASLLGAMPRGLSHPCCPRSARAQRCIRCVRMPNEISGDDIVRTHLEAAGNRRPPLLVLDPLLDFLDSHDLGEGEPTIAPIGNGLSNATYLFKRGSARFVLRLPPRPPSP